MKRLMSKKWLALLLVLCMCLGDCVITYAQEGQNVKYEMLMDEIMQSINMSESDEIEEWELEYETEDEEVLEEAYVDEALMDSGSDEYEETMKAYVEEAVAPFLCEEDVPLVGASSEYLAYEDYLYVVLDNGTVEISFYGGTDTEIVVPGIIDGMTVTSIGMGAFLYNEVLTKIELPSTIVSIGDCAFIDCTSLTDIEIPSGVTSLGMGVFFECTSLVSIKLPEGITDVGDKLFSGCTSLKYVELPAGLVSLGNYMFYNCSSLTFIELPNTITHIGDYLFYDCSGLTDIQIPSGVTYIGSYAFYGCSGLTNIELQSGVTYIGSYAFYGCTGLTDIEIPSGVTSIGGYAFRGCTGLTSMELPSGVRTIWDGLFWGCSNLKSVKLPSGVTSMAGYVFRECSSLTNIELPSGITSIGDYLFYECSSLTSIVLPSAATSIGEYAFNGCSRLTSIKLPSEVTSIGKAAFKGCGAITTIELPSGIASIGESAFEGCSSVTSICLPSGITCVEDSVFEDCSSLESIELPSEITEIGSYAFKGCKNLNNLELPSGITFIGSNVFEECSSLKSIELPSGINRIWDSAFHGCSSLISINIPSGVTKIGNSAFSGCSKLKNIELPSGLTSIGSSAFFGCGSLTELDLPEGITTIYKYTFEYCSSLTTIDLPEGITYIGALAFGECRNLTEIKLPNTINLEKNVFWRCHNLTIYCEENSYTHRYAVSYDIPVKFLAQKSTISPNYHTFIVKDIATNSLLSGVTVHVNQGAYTTDENGTIEVDLSNIGLEKVPIGVVTEDYEVYFAVMTLEKGAISYINLEPKENKFKLISAEVAYGDTTQNVLNQKVKLIYEDNTEGYIQDDCETFTLTLNANNQVTKYELLADGEVVDENTTGIFEYTIYTSYDRKEYSIPRVAADVPFADADNISVRMTNALDEVIEYKLGIKVSKAKIDVAKAIYSLDILEGMCIDVDDGNPFFCSSKLDFGFGTSKKLEVEWCETEGVIKVALNKFGNETMEEFERDYIYAVDNATRGAIDTLAEMDKFVSTFGAGSFGVDASIIGYGEGHYVENESGQIVINMGVVLSIGGSAKYTRYFLVSWVPIYISVKGSLTAKDNFHGSIVIEDDDVSFDVANDITLNLTLNPSVGVGFDEAFAIELDGLATVGATWKDMQKVQEIVFEGKLKADIEFVGWNLLSVSLIDKKMNLYKYQADTLTQSSAPLFNSAITEDLYDLSSYKLADRSYLTYDTANDDIPLFTASSEGATVVKEAVYPQAAPRIIKAGGKYYLFWLEDIPSRLAENRSALVYSVSTDGANWSEPVQLISEGENSTADYYYDIVADGNKLHVLYVEAAEEFATGVDLYTITENLAVSYAVIDTTSNTVTTKQLLTNSAGCYMLPQVDVVNGNVYVAWTTNNLASEDGLFGSGNTYTVDLMNMSTNKSVYSKTLNINQSVLSMDMGNNGGVTLACVVDTDGSRSTTADCELALINSSGALSFITDNDVADGSPVFTELNGNESLLWYQDGKLMCSENMTGAYEISGVAGYDFNASFDVVDGTAGKVIWEAKDMVDETQTNIYAMDYLGNQSWSTPYVYMTTDSEAISRANGCAADNGTLFTYLRTIYQADGSRIKSVCVKNADMYTDIALDYVLFEDEAVLAGQNLALTITVTNTGSQTVNAFDVTSNGTVIASVSEADLGLGETKTYTINGFVVPENLADGLANYEIGVAASGDNNQQNNTYDIQLGYTDLYVVANTSLVRGEEYLNVSVLNNSDVPASGVVKLHVDTEEGEVVYKEYLNTVSRDGGIGFSIPIEEYTDEHVVFYVTVEADRDEYLVSNNTEFIYTGFGTGMDTSIQVPEPEVYTVTFDSAGGSSVAAQSVTEGNVVLEPEAPTRADYNFAGWYLNGTEYNFQTAVTGNITLVAAWEEQVRLATPQATLATGSVVEAGTKFNITCASMGVDIYYTTDGSQPTTASKLYTGAITINEDMTVKAIAVKNGFKQSATAVFTYKVVKDISLKSITLSTTSATLKPGETKTLTVTYNPTNTTANKSVTWTSSNPSVATVDANGKVTAKATGTATITAKVGSFSATAEITVSTDATVTSGGILMISMDRNSIVAGHVTEVSKTAELQYRWTAYNKTTQTETLIQDWTDNNEWLNWEPASYGEYVITADVRVKYNPTAMATAQSEAFEFNPHIKGKCQMPYTGVGGGYLIGVESYENPNQSYYYEMLILDCTLLAEGKDAWVYTTGKYKVSEGNAGWCIWQPQYGYYWTLFRVYDADGEMIDQACYGFANVY